MIQAHCVFAKRQSARRWVPHPSSATGVPGDRSSSLGWSRVGKRKPPPTAVILSEGRAATVVEEPAFAFRAASIRTKMGAPSKLCLGGKARTIARRNPEGAGAFRHLNQALKTKRASAPERIFTNRCPPYPPSVEIEKSSYKFAPKASSRPSQSFTTNSRVCHGVSPSSRANSTPLTAYSA